MTRAPHGGQDGRSYAIADEASPHSVYWYRKVIPADLRAIVGKREIQRTLGTKDLREAKRRCPSVAEQVEREIALAEGERSRRM